MNNKCLNRANCILIIFLIIIYGFSLYSYLYILIVLLKYKNQEISGIPNFTVTIINISILIIVLLLTFFFGLFSFCFISRHKLLVYIITLSIMVIFQSCNIMLLQPELEEPHLYTWFVFFTDCFEVVFCFVDLVICMIERERLLQEIEESPLKNIDENLTEEVYIQIVNRESTQSETNVLQGFFNGLSALTNDNSSSSKEEN